MSFDCLCFNKECIQKKQIFINSQTPIAIHEGHDVRPIHRITVASMVGPIQQQQQKIGTSVQMQSLIDAKNQAIEEIMKAVQRLFNFRVIYQAQCIQSQSHNINSKDIIQSLRIGSHFVFDSLLEYQQLPKKLDFAEFFNQKIKWQLKNLEQSCLLVKQQLLSEIQKLTKLKPNGQAKDIMKQQFRSKGVSDKNLYQLSISQQPSEQEEDSNQQQQKHSINDKTKVINKHRSGKFGTKHKRFLPSSGIKKVQEGQIIVFNCRNNSITLNYIFKTYANLDRMHIMSHNLANSQSLKSIFKNYRSLKKITLNCNHQFDPYMIQNYSQQSQNKLNLYVKWDLATFFQQYFVFDRFPKIAPQNKQRKTPVYYSKNTHASLNSEMVWIFDKNAVPDLNSKKISTVYVDILNVNTQTNFKQIMPHLFKCTQITTLVLKGIVFDQWSQRTQTSFKNFKQLSTAVIENCTFRSMQKDIFDKLLSVLPNQTLAQFAVSNIIFFQPAIDLNQFTNKKSLKSLHLDGFKFKNYIKIQPGGAYFNNLMTLNQLTYLDLQNCPQVNNQFLQNIHPEARKILKYLNLSKTNIDGRCQNILKDMSALQYLSVSHTRMTCQALLDTQKSIYLGLYSRNHLKQLNISGCKGDARNSNNLQRTPSDDFNQTNLSILAHYLPQLQYLNIAYLKSLSSCNFQLFKKLRILAVDSDQTESLKDIVHIRVQLFDVQKAQYSKIRKIKLI